MAKQSQEGLTIKKQENFSEWYQQLILKSDLADYSSVSGCIIFKPTSYQIWEKIKQECDKEFKKIKIQNCYFPLFIPEKLLKQEQTHVKGFAPEVAWVTQAGKSKLKERLAIRPTSEAIMYEAYSKWIKSYRDLPLRLNQWNNVVRWEFKHPVPFLRTREFLWNEGHHAYSNKKELEQDKKNILNIYQKILKEYMALPGLIGRKTEKEKFAGAQETYSIELILPNNKAIQGPDYHDDGQNFAKAYNIQFLDKNGKKQYAYQSTYAISTRMLGIMFAIHSDDKGLIIPPKLAENKIVIIPILFENTEAKVLKKAEEIKRTLQKFNPILDKRKEYSPGWKFHEWELKGIPLRIEIGPKDLENKQVIVVKRNDGKKQAIKINNLNKEIPEIIEQIQKELYTKAENFFKNTLTTAQTLNELKNKIKEKKIVLAPLCNNKKCEDILKEKINGIKTLNIPENQPPIKNKKCIVCGKIVKELIYLGKSY